MSNLNPSSSTPTLHRLHSDSTPNFRLAPNAHLPTPPTDPLSQLAPRYTLHPTAPASALPLSYPPVLLPIPQPSTPTASYQRQTARLSAPVHNNPVSHFNSSKLSATMRHLRKGTSSEKALAEAAAPGFPKSFSNSNINSFLSPPTAHAPASAAAAVPPAASAAAAAGPSTLHNATPQQRIIVDPAYHNQLLHYPHQQLHRRPLSAPQHSSPTSALSTNRGRQHFFYRVATPSIYINYPTKRDLLPPAPTPTTKTLSFLECVLELLKGTTVYKRKTFMHHPRVYLWLTPSMNAIKYRLSKKGSDPVVDTVPLKVVSKLRGTDREISVECTDYRKRLDFMFCNKGRADIWLSGLCCLVPAIATVRSRNTVVSLRDYYDPLTDTWNGKKLEYRKRLDDYILLGTIGRGSFGKVKLALGVTDRRFYAVKVLNKAMMRKRLRSTPVDGMYVNRRAASDVQLEDVNEIQVMAGLSHNNVMALEGVYNDTEEDRFYIVLEFVARGPIMSSAKLKGAEPLSEDRARTAFIDVVAGLQYLHSNHIAHRDIKPDNLLEAGDGTVKISDFGAAVMCKPAADGSPFTDHSTAGTPAFTAPEVAISDNTPKQPVDFFAADMWSLGATLYYMLSGQAPFIARSVFEMYHTICTEELRFPENLETKSDVCNLIALLLHKSPEKRATFEDVLNSPWISKCNSISKKVREIREALNGDTQKSTSASKPGSSTKATTRGWYRHGW